MIHVDGRVYPLRFPLPAGGCELFAGSTAGVGQWSCRAHSLSRSDAPMSLHRHEEEELLVVLDGELQLDLPDAAWLRGNRRLTLRRGEVAFFPPGFPHALGAGAHDPAHCVSLTWRDAAGSAGPGLGFLHLDTSAPGALGEARHPWGSRQKQIMSPTAHLGTLKCHVSTVAPGAGYAAHADPYDVVIVTLEGDVETLGDTVSPESVIFYPADSLHGMRNPGNVAARYVVFELHSRRRAEISPPRPPLWVRLADPRRWQRRIRGLLAR